jgi:membrane protease YdiL (CAAX protease family)
LFFNFKSDLIDYMPWDFAAILAFLAIAVPLLGRRRIQQLMRMPHTSKADRLSLYASTVAFQWIAVAVILWRVAAHRIAPLSLGIAAPSPQLILLVSILLSVLILANQALSLRRLQQLPKDAQGILPQLALKVFPQDSVERLAFLLVVATVAICEELIFRGFALHVVQNSLNGSVLAGVLASSVLFAIAHLYQGRRGLIATFVVGIIFATARVWTGSLIAPIVAHFSADLTAGFLAPRRFRDLAARPIGPITLW